MSYLETEYKLYRLLEEQADCLWSHPSFTDILYPYNASKRDYFDYKLRMFFDVSKLELQGIDIKRMVYQLYQEYTEASESRFFEKKRDYPERFPVIFEDTVDSQVIIDRALVKINKAISSQNVQKIGQWYSVGRLTDKQIKLLKKQGIPLSSKDRAGQKDILISVNWLKEKYGDKAQVRLHTGFAYRVTFSTNIGTIKRNAGLLLFNQSFPVTFAEHGLRSRPNAFEYEKIEGLDFLEIRPSI